MKALREKETKELQWNQSEMVHLIKSTVQSALVPVVEQMKEQEREMVNTLQQQQSEWIDSITSRIQQHQEIVDNNCKAMEQKAERRENGYRQALEHQIGA